MDLQEKHRDKPFWYSFIYAIEGIVTVVKHERNMRFHLLSSCIVLLMSFYFSIDKMEWLIVLILISGMFCLEMVNTAIERVVDLVTLEYKPLAKQAKDVAAGAVLVYAFVSIIIGALIFIPYVFKLLRTIEIS
ncbi:MULTISPECIES: diacylglycerol kinase family protein [Neobacillus]|jgi:undecaprenol kinase|uniref:Diacylglycerol kinase family protein n=1 Tax=Neobacillus sedimentimangrovi TaxID=2699460 RepID=A0ABS8QI73_9BACI|nr:diacylglycerol kinase family protein [Neobacillus sedimentimangrovi]MCD4838531.1 diacylglycerol kinase family protein [Neobacillus sedimentimangrovi]